MGGSTGRTKDKIIQAMYDAELQGKRIPVKDLAKLLELKNNTISEHLRNLYEKHGYVRETPHLRGRWELTEAGRSYIEALQVRQSGIEYYGIIAAGPAVPILDNPGEHVASLNLDPHIHFAMRVRGDSMVSYGILDGDLVIFRRVSNWLEVPEGTIVAARVPEGTGADGDDWLEQLEQNTRCGEGAHMPPLDHVTLKRFDGRFRAYLSQGIEYQRAWVKLHGSKGVWQPPAVAIAGVMVRLVREYE